MGSTGVGKSTFINLVSGSELPVGHDLRSCTDEVRLSKPFYLNGRWITLIDTPGFGDTDKKDTDVLNLIAAFLATSFSSGKRLAGVLYFHCISDARMGGVSTRNFKMFRELCGDAALQNVVIVTTMWEKVYEREGSARERELQTSKNFFLPALEKGARMMRHYGSKRSAEAIIQSVVNNNPLPLRIQTELVDEKKGISETSAGIELEKELQEQLRMQEADLKGVMEEQLKEKDNEAKRQLQMATDELSGEISELKRQSENQTSDYERQRNAFEQMIGARRIAEEEYKTKIADLEEKLAAAAQTATSRERSLKDEPHQLKEVGEPRKSSDRDDCVIQ